MRPRKGRTSTVPTREECFTNCLSVDCTTFWTRVPPVDRGVPLHFNTGAGAPACVGSVSIAFPFGQRTRNAALLLAGRFRQVNSWSGTHCHFHVLDILTTSHNCRHGSGLRSASAPAQRGTGVSHSLPPGAVLYQRVTAEISNAILPSRVLKENLFHPPTTAEDEN